MKLVPKSKFNPIKKLLAFPLFIILVFIIVIAYWNYDKYSDLRKRFKGYRNIVPEPFETKKHTFIISGPLPLHYLDASLFLNVGQHYIDSDLSYISHNQTYFHSSLFPQ